MPDSNSSASPNVERVSLYRDTSLSAGCITQHDMRMVRLVNPTPENAKAFAWWRRLSTIFVVTIAVVIRRSIQGPQTDRTDPLLIGEPHVSGWQPDLYCHQS